MFALPDLRPTFRPDVMKAVISKHAFAYSIVLVVLLCAIDAVLAQPRKSLTLNETAFAFAAQLIKGNISLRTVRARGANIGVHQMKRMILSVCMDSVNMPNGISGLTSDSLRRQSADTSFLMAILKTSIVAVCSPQRAGPLNTDIMTLNMQQHS